MIPLLLYPLRSVPCLATICTFLILYIPSPALVNSANILLMPFPYPSHVAQLSFIGKELLANGHTVYVMLSASFPGLDQVKVESGFKVIEHAVAEPDFYTLENPEAISPDYLDSSLCMNPLEEMRLNVDGFVSFCTNPLGDATLGDRLRDLNLDLAVVDAFPYTRCYWILLHRLEIPYVSMTTNIEPWLLRVPNLPSFVPSWLTLDGRYTERMSFGERLRNLLSLIDWTVRPGLTMADNEFVRRYLPSETYSSLAAKSLVWFIDTDTVLDYPRPTMPNEVNIGGLSSGPPKPLTGHLEKFVNSSTGGASGGNLVVVAFGSMDYVTERYFQQLFDAFSQLTDLIIVWRYGGKIPASHDPAGDQWPKHLMIQEWLPQNDLLGHRNTRLLITHCGSNSQFEAVYHGVPTICLPFWGDQMYNAARMSYRGYGLDLGCMRDVTAAKLVAGVHDVIKNRSYADNVRAASAIFRSRVQTPRQRALWWIEHVITHGGQHIHSYCQDMPWYQYLMLDILAVCVLLPLVLLTSSVTACLFWCCQRRQKPAAAAAAEHLKHN